MGRNDGRCLAVALGDLVLLGLLMIVAEVHALDIDGRRGGVVKLHPVVALVVVIHVDAIVGTDLIDADRRDALSGELGIGKFGEGSGEADGSVARHDDGGLLRVDGAALLPCCEAIACGSLGLEGDGAEEMALEVRVWHIDAIDEDACAIGIDPQGNRLPGDCRELHRRELLQIACHLLGTVLQVVLDLISGALGIVAVVDALLLHHVAHGLDIVQQFIDNGIGTVRFEHTASNETERIDELPAIHLVIQQVEEEVDEVVVLLTGLLMLLEPVEGIVAAVIPTFCEGVVEVEADKAVATVVTAAVGLDVVVGPVVVEEEQGDSHIVGELIDVEQTLQLIVGACIVDVLAQLIDALEYLVVTILDLLVLESVELLVVVTPVGIGKLVVVGLTQVEHTAQLTVDVFNNRYVGLHVDIDARALDDGLEGRIGEAGVI